MLNSPAVLLVVVRITPVSTCLIVTVAPATAAPLESVTVPKIVPRKVCPHPGAAKIAIVKIAATTAKPRAHHDGQDRIINLLIFADTKKPPAVNFTGPLKASDPDAPLNAHLDCPTF